MVTGECVLWAGAISDQGYARSRRGYVHRAVWEDRHGPIPAGMQVDHACHNATGCHLLRDCPHRRCVNLGHLQLVTPRVNVLLKLAPIGWEDRILTHCLRDHERSPGNTYYGPDGKRRCLACRAEDQRRFQARQRAGERARAGQLTLW